jgi:hypothetical protein
MELYNCSLSQLQNNKNYSIGVEIEPNEECINEMLLNYGIELVDDGIGFFQTDHDVKADVFGAIVGVKVTSDNDPELLVQPLRKIFDIPTALNCYNCGDKLLKGNNNNIIIEIGGKIIRINLGCSEKCSTERTGIFFP